MAIPPLERGLLLILDSIHFLLSHWHSQQRWYFFQSPCLENEPMFCFFPITFWDAELTVKAKRGLKRWQNRPQDQYRSGRRQSKTSNNSPPSDRTWSTGANCRDQRTKEFTQTWFNGGRPRKPVSITAMRNIQAASRGVGNCLWGNLWPLRGEWVLRALTG